jgi:hypothetical protein
VISISRAEARDCYCEWNSEEKDAEKRRIRLLKAAKEDLRRRKEVNRLSAREAFRTRSMWTTCMGETERLRERSRWMLRLTVDRLKRGMAGGARNRSVYLNSMAKEYKGDKECNPDRAEARGSAAFHTEWGNPEACRYFFSCRLSTTRLRF